MTKNLRERLRTETNKEHKCVEQTLNILSDQITKERYNNILISFLRFHEGFEAFVVTHSCKTWSPVAIDYLKNRLKSNLIVSDLGANEFENGSSEITFHWINNESKLLGALYVVEGSTLGGQLISRTLSKTLPGVSLNYFSGYGPRTGKMWQDFSTNFDLVAEENFDDVVNGAKHMFKLLNDHLLHS